MACDRWYEFHTKHNLLVTGPVEGHTSPCGQEDGLASDTLRTGLLDHLKESNFNVATLPEDIYETMPYGRITHAQASICILKKIHGLSFVAPAAEGVFQDVPSVDPYAAWMEQLFREGLIDACSDVQVEICPGNEFTLEDAAKLILRLKNGTMYIPSATVQSLNHSCSSPASPWVEEFQNQGFLAGCTEDAFNCCPEKTVDILQLAGFLSRVLKGS